MQKGGFKAKMAKFISLKEGKNEGDFGMSEVLDFFYDNPLPKKGINPRKRSIINGGNKLVVAPPKYGKSSLLIEYALTLPKKSYLYLDMNDARVSFEAEELALFCKQNSIKTLIIDNYYYNFELPQNRTLILSSEYEERMEGFEKIELKGLDFEEFISFQKTKEEPSSLFGSYVKNGVLPELATLGDFVLIKRAQEIPKLITASPQEEDILRFLFGFIGVSVSVNHLFTLYKREEKISKDRFYEVFKNLKERRVIHTVPGVSKEVGGKLYFFDYGVRNANILHKEYQKTLQNLLFLELDRRFEAIFSLAGVDFFIPEKNIGFISMPFLKKEKLQNLPPLNHIYILTNGYFEKISKNVTAMSFWEWLISE